ncbi:hypothetical protein ACHCAK_22450 [Raoultella ornithinolytica]|uniref:hypothetical protein n=1 Tax=Raoultella ornithinolytica TaxID=54291 RepID=UPI002275B9C1|nr:hypothetical protein [Raoultella ornithinolytica]EKU0200103.1 hypothetical protein [Raoultella ornithinolytica]EKU0200710.1 hypothetical protein [Raoultella ornithinolytica]EKV4103481.1 hypothetical protein [Raoultella ornithinolytica]EKV8288480.1 hypothetical protein [Raoultella ornithinolytica]
MQNPDVHYAGDGLGPRDVLVNGNPINHVVYANLAKGIVEFAPRPLRVKRNGEIYTRKLRGRVLVRFTGGYVSNNIPLQLFGEKGMEEVDRGYPRRTPD